MVRNVVEKQSKFFSDDINDFDSTRRINDYALIS